MKIFLACIAIVLLVCAGLCLSTQKSSYQTAFLAGRPFAELPDGFWKGDTNLPKGPWLGKRFSAGTAEGVNVFQSGADRTEQFSFRMYTAEALWDKGHEVTRIDYNVPENPFWLRPALDEVVEVSPGKLLGKIHYRVFPGVSIAIGYFWQQEGETINP